MQKKEFSQCLDGLMHYALERQASFEAHQTGALSLNPSLRNDRTRELINGMAQLCAPDEAEACVKAFDDLLRSAQTTVGVECLPQPQQRMTVQGLYHYAQDLINQDRDTRSQLLQISDHLEDMASCLTWNAPHNRLGAAIALVNREIPRITARENLLFTRILLGGECGPAASDFVGGAVTKPEDIVNTYLFDDMTLQYPEIESWPAVVTVYRGGYGMEPPKKASEFDLDIMRRYGDSFVELKGIEVCRYPEQVWVSAQQNQEPQGGLAFSTQ